MSKRYKCPCGTETPVDAEGRVTESHHCSERLGTVARFVWTPPSATEPRRKVSDYRGQSSPWADFLHHRARALRWLRDEMNETPEKTAQTMAMDPGQVRLILAHIDANPKEFER
jgi:hypothetical protein